MDTIQVVRNAVPDTGHTGDARMYVAIAELLVIIALCVRLCVRWYKPKRAIAKGILSLCVQLYMRHKHGAERANVRDRILHEGDIDFKNIIDSSLKAKALYDELKGKCHPDKFATNAELNATATEIFSLLVKYKHDYAMLCKLRDRAVNELHIHLK